MTDGDQHTPSSMRSRVTEFCTVCGGIVAMQIFKGTGYCCELCRKVGTDEMTREEANVQRMQ